MLPTHPVPRCPPVLFPLLFPFGLNHPQTSKHNPHTFPHLPTPYPVQIPDGGPHKRSTHGKLFQGSPFFTQQLMTPKSRSSTVSSVQLGTNTQSQSFGTAHSKPTSTYHGNGSFVVELPHTTITYRRTWSTKNTAMQSEYGAKYQGARTGVRGSGYSVLSRRQ